MLQYFFKEEPRNWFKPKGGVRQKDSFSHPLSPSIDVIIERVCKWDYAEKYRCKIHLALLSG